MIMKVKKRIFVKGLLHRWKKRDEKMIHDEWKGREWRCLFRLKEKAENGGDLSSWKENQKMEGEVPEKQKMAE